MLVTIEVHDGSTPAELWQRAYASDVGYALLDLGARSWEWRVHPWGVSVLIDLPEDLEFSLEASPLLERALSDVPDPADGLRWYFGDGESGAGVSA